MEYIKLGKYVLHPQYSTEIFETIVVPIHNSSFVIWILQADSSYISRLCLFYMDMQLKI